MAKPCPGIAARNATVVVNRGAISRAISYSSHRRSMQPRALVTSSRDGAAVPKGERRVFASTSSNTLVALWSLAFVGRKR